MVFPPSRGLETVSGLQRIPHFARAARRPAYTGRIFALAATSERDSSHARIVSIRVTPSRAFMLAPIPRLSPSPRMQKGNLNFAFAALETCMQH